MGKLSNANAKFNLAFVNAKLNFDGMEARIEFGKLLPFPRREELEVEKGTATREGEPATGKQLVHA